MGFFAKHEDWSGCGCHARSGAELIAEGPKKDYNSAAIPMSGSFYDDSENHRRNGVSWSCAEIAASGGIRAAHGGERARRSRLVKPLLLLA